MFSYGSGSASSLFSFKVRSLETFDLLSESIKDQLSSRVHLSAAEFDHLMMERKVNFNRFGWKPKFNPEIIRKESYILQEVKPRGERVYCKFSEVEKISNGNRLGHNIHALSAAGHGNQRLAMISSHMLHSSTLKNPPPSFDKFYKKDINQRRLAVRFL